MTRNRTRGFTLIEVLVALAIVALALGAIAVSMGHMIGTANAMRERMYASWIALNEIAEMRLANVVPEVSTTSGTVDFANRSWAWTAEVSETGVENLMRVDLSVSAADSDYVIRTVTGFIGEPVIPGQSNIVWNSRQFDRGEER